MKYLLSIKKMLKRKKKYTYVFLLGLFIGIIIPCIFSISINSINSTITIILFISTSILLSILIIYLFFKRMSIFEFQELLEELDKEIEIKKALFQLNHEIKNPLAVVNGYLDMIERTTNKDKQKKYHEIIKKEIKRSINIINDFSILGKLKKIDKEPIDLSLIFDDVIELFNPLLKEKNGIINIDNLDELYIMGDYERLKQVFVNLIKNSIESKDKDFIIIDIKTKKYKDFYKIYIKDNGQGMSKEVLNHIEDTFYSTKQQGTGIGLSYVRKIIELHQGKISFKSKEKEGTTAIVNIPLMN